MNWSEIRLALEYFLYGVAAGYFLNPLWALIKKIVSEAKKAKEEW